MNTTAKSVDVDKLRLNLRWAWTGPAAGIACMVALFIAGILTNTPQMMVVSSSVAATMAVLWVSISASLRRQITQAER